VLLSGKWKTDFNYDKFGGWQKNQTEETHERDILVIIPGKDRSRTVIMADHYDTAYMEDIYNKSRGGSGARLSAAGADDNHSATATLLQAAPIFLELSHNGMLEHDVWLLHLTGEEFPSDCMGARYFCQAAMEKQLKIKLSDNSEMDLSDTRVVGVFVLDMIAHNKSTAMDIFQISTGKSPESLKLSYAAHCANMIWNKSTEIWNSGSERRNLKRSNRVKHISEKPQPFAHLPLSGEVRTQDDPQSSLYNTDGQIFSDVGMPVVLFMENYDLNRNGYHDTKDTMENIDLDYGAAVAAIAIETVARTAAFPQSLC
jgi:Zn-dependent M28 family amino/carboxypeptidase